MNNPHAMTAQAGAVAARQEWFERELVAAERQWIDAFSRRWEEGDDVPSKDHFIALWFAERSPPAAVLVEALEELVKLKEAYCHCDGTQEAEDAAILAILNKIDELTQPIKERSNGR